MASEQKQSILRIKWFRILATALVLIGLYALMGIVFAPKLVRNAILHETHEKLGLEASVGEIHINPFLFQIEIQNLTIPDAAGAKLIGFDRLFVDFEVSSLWRRAYTFSNIQIDKPFANAIIAPDGGLNLRALEPKSHGPAPPPKPEKPLPAIRIHNFAVTHGFVTYDDRSRNSEFSARIDPISFALTDFTTGSEGGQFKFAGSSKLGEGLEWHGHVSLQPLASDGDFRVSSLQAKTIYDYLNQQLGFVIHSGAIDLDGHYRFALRNVIDFQVRLAQVAITNLGIGPSRASAGIGAAEQVEAPTAVASSTKEASVAEAVAVRDWVSLPGVTLNSSVLDFAARKVQVANLTVTGAKLDTWLDRDGKLNLLQLARASGASRSGAMLTPAVTATSMPNTSAQPWQVGVDEIDINNARIGAEDRSTLPAAKMSLASLWLKMKGVNLDLSKPVTVEFASRINETGTIKLAGNLTPQPLSGDMDVDLGGIELKAVQPYIAQHTGITLLAGHLSASGKLHYAELTKAAAMPPQRRIANAAPALSFAGTLSVDRLHTIDSALRKDLVNWDHLQIAGLKFQHDPDRLQIEKITAIKPYARVIIAPDRSFNVTDALSDPNSRSMAVQSDSAAAAPSPKVNASPAKSATVMPIAIKQVLIQKGDASFADLSIKPNFAAGIQALEGTINGLSSDGKTRARVDLHGEVDRFSPVSIEGEMNLLSTKLYTDLAISFRNMELTTFNPYSGKFAGYNISKGKLTTELKYKIDGRKLEAGHHIVIDQLEFGDKTASKDAVSVPIKLAVALLKDRHGVIDLDIPVTGSLDDPQFRLGPIIWKVVLNLLVKVVTSPFALLGSLFGGGADLQFIDFPAGSAQLDQIGQQKMKGVAKALAERPQLKIEIPIASVPELDRPALVERHFDELIQDELVQGGKKKQAAAEMPKFAQLTPTEQLDILSKVYKAQVGTAPQFPEGGNAAESMAPERRAQGKAEALSAKIEFLRAAVQQHIAIQDNKLQALGQQRAEAMQQQLITDTQIDPTRVFLVANKKATASPASSERPLVRLELSLQ